MVAHLIIGLSVVWFVICGLLSFMDMSEQAKKKQAPLGRNPLDHLASTQPGHLASTQPGHFPPRPVPEEEGIRPLRPVQAVVSRPPQQVQEVFPPLRPVPAQAAEDIL